MVEVVEKVVMPKSKTNLYVPTLVQPSARC
jgi:hypothetical protein